MSLSSDSKAGIGEYEWKPRIAFVPGSAKSKANSPGQTWGIQMLPQLI